MSHLSDIYTGNTVLGMDNARLVVMTFFWLMVEYIVPILGVLIVLWASSRKRANIFGSFGGSSGKSSRQASSTTVPEKIRKYAA